jgi:sugar fermentation stimulation protein A
MRRNRFAADVEVDGRAALAHVPNSGRMHELFVEGASVLLRPAPEGSTRRTAYDLLLIEYNERWVGVDSRVPPSIIVDAWRLGMLPMFQPYTSVRREVTFGASRLDLLFEGPRGKLYVEAKSVNLVEERAAMFPDAPTARGLKHLYELRDALSQGHGAAVVFVVQRDDVDRLVPFVTADAAFAAGLREVVADGVEAYAIACTVTPDGLTPSRLVPVELGHGATPSRLVPVEPGHGATA